MKILLFGGFLGSGKTTVINQIMRSMVAEGNQLAVIENEIGAISIDDKLIGQTDVAVTPLFGGCVCCQITGDLLTALQRIESDIHPDWIIVEMTGLALMRDIREKLLSYGKLDARITTISVVDASRWEILMRAMPKLIADQIDGADLVLANKSDIKPLTDQAFREISEFSHDAPCISISAVECRDLWKIIQEVLPDACL